MSKKITIATASSAEYFHFLQGMVLSVRDKPESKDIDISLYDLGLSDEQFVEAVAHAPATRPDRFTILEHLDLDEEAIRNRVHAYADALAG